MNLAEGRDIALMVIAFLHAIIAFIVFGIFGVLWYFSGKGFGALERLLEQKVRPALDKVEKQLIAVRDRTAALPGNESIGAGSSPKKSKAGGLLNKLPFRKKRRRIPFLPS